MIPKPVLGLFLAIGAALAAPAAAEPRLPPAGLSGTLDKVARTGIVSLGYREASIPFSFLDPRGRPVGYSLDLCRAIVEEIGHTLGRTDLKTELVKVTSETRFAAIIEGKADLECGSTTANLERARTVSFSPLIFVAGTMVMVPRGTPWKSFHDLRGRKVAVTAGTTNLEALRKLDAKFGLSITLMEAPDHEQSYRLLAEGKAGALASDNILLAGLLAQHKSKGRFAVVGDVLSYDPYGIVYRHGDKPMRDVIERAFRTLVVGNEIGPIYDKWFAHKLPNGEAFNIPMSPQLEEAFKAFATEIEPERN
ncbi:MAG: amino acid ABC transporter substrate-binding protein [Magnetospirillum sp.]|nr:amino acid ABC transporter substrate-binding protein [Magnetospirillum sp.]